VSGDSIANQQHVANALTNGSVTTYFDTGSVALVVVRAVAPIYDTDGSIIGALSADFRFDINETVDELKNILKADINVWLENKNIVTTITRQNGERALGLRLDPSISKIVMNDGKEYNGTTILLEKPRRFFCMPLRNSKGEIFAAISIGNPIEEMKAASRNLIIEIFFIGFIGLAIAIILMFFIVSILIKSVVTLSVDMNEIALGNLNIEINVESSDEVGNLAKSIKKMINVIRKMIVDINIMIYEHAKGNSDYRLDTEGLLGDYKILANNISELADESMKDRLTKMSNRHTFDNRLELEWNRAMRDRTLLSALMIDLDKFKGYNDTFGHAQGDLALQAAAEVFMCSIKSKIDFAARWGGEEFVILLPSTDSISAITVAERIRAAIENMSIPCNDERAAKITVSIGVNTQMPAHHSNSSSLILKADEALYKAKQTGRNKVVFWG
jgi:diguanylate cyclase (GGDEF)-like protein